MSKIYYRIRGQELNLSIPVPVVENTIDYIEAEASFTSDWNSAKKWLLLMHNDVQYKVLLVDDKMPADKHINLASGEWFTWVMGDVYNEAGYVRTRITTNVVSFTVLESGIIDDNIVYVPATVGEQILGVAQEAVNRAKNAEELANDVIDRANRGEFVGGKGEKGDKGDRGEQGIQGVQGVQGIQGLKGDSGVYVGGDPVPAGTKVQVNPVGELDGWVVPPGGMSGQVLKKNSNADFDYSWKPDDGGGGGGSWGSITGTLADQTDLQTALDSKLDKSGGTITGNLTINQNLRFPGTAYIASLGKTIFKSSGSGTELGNAERLTTVLGSGTRPKYNDADMALLSDIPDISGKADRPTIATELPGSGHTLVVNTQYYLGLVADGATIYIEMPNNAQVGQEILVVFTNAGTTSVSSSTLPDLILPLTAGKTTWAKFTLYKAADPDVTGDVGEWLVETKEG